MKCNLANVYNRFLIDGANCGVLVRGMIDKKLRINTYGGPVVVVKTGTSWQLDSTLAAAQK